MASSLLSSSLSRRVFHGTAVRGVCAAVGRAGSPSAPAAYHAAQRWQSSYATPRLQKKPNLITGGLPRGQRRPVYHSGEVLALDENHYDSYPVNGNGAVNGHGAVNGNGAVNGHGAVNGNGAAAGLLANGRINNGHSAVNGHSELNNERSYESDLVVVLDMDECLVHSQFISETAASQWAHQVSRAEEQDDDSWDMDDDESSSDFAVDSFKITLPDGDLVHVNKRPHLEVFLREVTQKYETHVFTAAMEVYASPVLDTLDPLGTMFAQRWYRESCTFQSQVGAYVKDLTKLPFPSNRIVLVDNNPLSFLANPSNGILVSNFYDDPTDNTLQSVLELLHELKDEEDVRPVLDQRFGLRDALQEVTKTGRYQKDFW